MTKADINANFREARKTGGAVKADGWTFIATMEHNMPRGGPMAAWDYVYTLVSPTGTRHQFGKGQASAVNFAYGIIPDRQFAGAGLRDNSGRSVEQE